MMLSAFYRCRHTGAQRLSRNVDDLSRTLFPEALAKDHGQSIYDEKPEAMTRFSSGKREQTWRASWN
jgi:hypothetical protein